MSRKRDYRFAKGLVIGSVCSASTILAGSCCLTGRCYRTFSNF